MEWQIAFAGIIVVLLLLFTTGMPVAFCFLGLNLLGAVFIFSGEGLSQLVICSVTSIQNWTLVCLPMFIIMGEVLVQSGILPNMIDTIDECIGRMPGRLGLLAVGTGTIFATLSGSSASAYALLGSTLTPEMEKRGYKPEMSVGPILGSGGLAMMIPPSILAVVLASLGDFSAGKILIAIIVPGLLLAATYTIYILFRCWSQPSLAPRYEVLLVSSSRKLSDLARYILPLVFIIFAVTGVIFAGIASPTEASATGAVAAIILTACYGKLTWQVVKKTMIGTLEIVGMILFIIMSAMTFSRILAYSGATTGIIELTSRLAFPHMGILWLLVVIMIILGTFMDEVSVMMISAPIIYPLLYAWGMDPVWFGVVMLLVVEMGMISPPFGMGLFVMQGVVSEKITTADIYRASIPFLGCQFVVLLLAMFRPSLTLWLPGMMRGG